MQRRDFLSATLAAPLTAQSDRPRISIGFLGASHSHAEGKLKVVTESPDWRLAGVAENDPKLRDELAKQNVPLVTREQLLSDKSVTVIAVESAVREHGRDGLAVLEAGKHLHLEKAPAVNISDFEKIVRVATERKLLLQVGYMWRYHPGVEKALEAARNGWLGELYLLKGTIGNQLDLRRREEWGEFAGGVLYELGGHVIDPIVRLMAKPLKVTPFLRTDGASKDKLRDNTAAVFEWKGALGIVQCTTLQPGSSRFRALEIHGTNGWAVLNPIEPPILQIHLVKTAGPFQSGLQKISLPDYRRYVDDFVELASAIRAERPLRVKPAEDLAVHDALIRASGMTG